MSSKSNTTAAPAGFVWRSPRPRMAPFRRKPALRPILAACAASALMAPTFALAAKSCSLTTNPVAFGAYKATDASAKTGRGDVLVQCTCTFLDCVAFSYTLDVQSGGSGSVGDRWMTRVGGTSTLKYQLYSDGLGLAPWVAPQSQLFLLTNFSGGQTVYVYGRAAAGQAIVSGTYTDSPAVVITF